MPAFTVSRSTQIESDPETVFATVSDFATWQIWSPWLLTDRHAMVVLNGDPKKVGGGYSWDGPVVGAGEMEHAELSPPSFSEPHGKMLADLRFTRPWKSQARITVEVNKGKDAERREVTDVCWQMDGSLPFFMFWMKSMMVSVLSMDFDRGLRMLKELIEKGDVSSKTTVEGLTDTDAVDLIGLSGESTLQEIGCAMDAMITEIKKSMAEAGIATDGQWLSLYDDMCMKTQRVKFTCGMIRPGGAKTPPGLLARDIPSFKAMHVSHTGPYEHLGNAWATAYQNMRAQKHAPNSKYPGLEYYLNLPEDTPAAELVTDVYVPVK